MSRSNSGPHAATSSTATNNKKWKGVRRRKWGKYVSEIRVPGTQERLWLGTYATAEAAAVAHDVAVYCLKRPSSLEKLNFPDILSSYSIYDLGDNMSPRSVQKVASDVAMDVDAHNISNTNVVVKSTSITDDVEVTNYDERGNKTSYDVGGEGASWWEGLGDDDCGTSYGSSDQELSGEGDYQPLSISVDDYL